jgi:uncharacterized membrane protein YhiD involved in acid resistance
MTRFLPWYASLPPRRRLYFGIVTFFVAFGLCGFMIAVIRLIRSAAGDQNGLPFGIPIAMIAIGVLGAGAYLRIDRRERRGTSRSSDRP